MSKFENIVMSLVVGLCVSFGVVSPASAQGEETVGVSEVAEHVSSNTTTSAISSESQEASPIEALAEGAARLIALANSGSLSVGSNSANSMCPVLRGCSKSRCGVSSILTGENAITDEQYEQFYQLNIKKKDDMGPIKLEMKKNKRHMKEMMSKDELDVKAIKKMQDKMASLGKDMIAMKLDYKLQIAQVLTGAQRTALRKAMIKGGAKKYSAGRMMRKWMQKRMMK